MNSTQITFRDIPHSEAVYKQIHDYINKLTHHCTDFINCKVVLTAPPKHQHKGELYKVRVEVSLPTTKILINNKHNLDLYVAIHDSFQALEKKIESYLQRRHDSYHNVAVTAYGTIVKLFSEDNFGFIKDASDNEYYFNASHVVTKKFTQLCLGDEVNFTVATGKDGGLQAHHITCRHRA